MKSAIPSRFTGAAKPRVLVCVLTGAERHNWLSPQLSMNLLQMAKESRFEVHYMPICDFRPWEVARNFCIHRAREMNVDWLVMMDNDNFTPGYTPLDVITIAGKDKHVIGLSCGVQTGNGHAMFPWDGHGVCAGQFREQEYVGSGVLMVHKTVWGTIPRGPYFKWQHAENELLAAPPWEPQTKKEVGEDVFFCRLARQHGIKVWTHTQLLAGHYRTIDLTGMVMSKT